MRAREIAMHFEYQIIGQIRIIDNFKGERAVEHDLLLQRLDEERVRIDGFPLPPALIGPEF